MLVTAREVLQEARHGAYAIPGFDCVEDVMVRAILEEAEAQRAPVFMMCLVPDLQGNGWAYLPGLIRVAAEHHRIPVVLHLDHATDLADIRRAVELGFTSVMIDGSQLPLEENIALTRETVRIAHPKGVSVEAELGHVGGADLECTVQAENVLTDPAEVTRFIEETGVDSLAVSIGTSHGVYRSLPTLHIDRLKELSAASSVPLVLHGGSGTPDEQIREAVAHGICKLNIYADCRIAMGRGLKRAAQELKRVDPLPQQIFGPMKEELQAVVRQKIELLGTAGRA